MNTTEEKVLADMLLERFELVIPEWDSQSDNVFFEHTFEGYELISLEFTKQPQYWGDSRILRDVFVRPSKKGQAVKLTARVKKYFYEKAVEVAIRDGMVSTVLATFPLK